MARWLVRGTTFLLGISITFSMSCGDEEKPAEPTPLAADLSVEPAVLDFGVQLTELALLLTNTGGGTLIWACGCGAANVSFQPAEGSIATATEVDTITVSVSREGLSPGSYTDTLAISSNGGTVQVPVSVSVGLTPLPSVLGEYEGIYAYTTDYGFSTQQTTEYPILWRFSDQNYWCWDNSAEGEDCICEPSGEYIIADDVELTMREDGCAGCVFDPSKLPDGVFTLRQPPDPQTGQDSVVLTQIIDDIRKDIRLARQN